MAILLAMNTRLAQMIPALLVVIAVACATQPTSNLTPTSSPPPLLLAATPQNADLEALELSIAKYDDAMCCNCSAASCSPIVIPSVTHDNAFMAASASSCDGTGMVVGVGVGIAAGGLVTTGDAIPAHRSFRRRP